jgi:hypothetical protein
MTEIDWLQQRVKNGMSVRGLLHKWLEIAIYGIVGGSAELGGNSL